MVKLDLRMKSIRFSFYVNVESLIKCFFDPEKKCHGLPCDQQYNILQAIVLLHQHKSLSPVTWWVAYQMKSFYHTLMSMNQRIWKINYHVKLIELGKSRGTFLRMTNYTSRTLHQNVKITHFAIFSHQIISRHITELGRAWRKLNVKDMWPQNWSIPWTGGDFTMQILSYTGGTASVSRK